MQWKRNHTKNNQIKLTKPIENKQSILKILIIWKIVIQDLENHPKRFLNQIKHQNYWGNQVKWVGKIMANREMFWFSYRKVDPKDNNINIDNLLWINFSNRKLI